MYWDFDGSTRCFSGSRCGHSAVSTSDVCIICTKSFDVIPYHRSVRVGCRQGKELIGWGFGTRMVIVVVVLVVAVSVIVGVVIFARSRT
jgi:hypothetical protein